MAKSRAGSRARGAPLGILIGVSENPRGVAELDRDGLAHPEPAALEPHPPPWRGVLVTIGGLAALAAVVLAVEPLREGVSDAVSGNPEALRDDLRGLSVAGALIVLGVGLVHVFVWYPAEILDTAVGYVYDFWVALPLVMGVWVVNAIIAYWIGRHVARPVLHRFINPERFDSLERLAERGGVTLLLAMRLIPIVPFSLFSYAAGAAHVPVGRFIWTTVVGYLPLTAVFVYLGNQLEELSPTDPLLWLAAAVLIALALLTARLRRLTTRSKAARAAEGRSPYGGDGGLDLAE
jgi:uncharacterized membrane protein YdjX (TVP38/TMEM64 family)